MLANLHMEKRSSAFSASGQVVIDRAFPVMKEEVTFATGITSENMRDITLDQRMNY